MDDDKYIPLNCQQFLTYLSKSSLPTCSSSRFKPFLLQNPTHHHHPPYLYHLPSNQRVLDTLLRLIWWLPQLQKGRRLADILQEKQEPFILEVYLLEKRHLKNSSKSDIGSQNCPGDNPGWFLKRSACVNKEKKLKPSNLLKAVYNKFISINVNTRVRNSGRSNGETGTEAIDVKIDQKVVRSERLSSSSPSSSNKGTLSSDELWKEYFSVADTFQTLEPNNMKGKEVL